MISSVFALSALAVATVAHARLPDGRFNANTRPMATVPKIAAIDSGLPVVDVNGTTIPPYNTTYYFTQLVDHKNPTAGTFQMRYWATWEFYKPGGCVVLMTPGEGNADGYSGYLTNRTINGQIAQQQNCAAFVVEHRFFGYSNPKPDLTVESLKLLTLEQSIADFDYFAKNIKLPFNGGDQLHPDITPWVFAGGSYSGALVSWAMNSVDSFWAGYSSSGVVQAITDFWGYFTPIRENMPKNCSADVEKVINHMDTVFTFGKKSDQQALKELFGLGAVTHNDDVTGALRNNLWDWQSDDPTSGPNSPFYQFCDALEVKDGVSAPATGWGLNHSLHAWGNYWKTSYLANICGDLDAEDCMTSYNSSQSYYTDTSIDNSGRSWTWFTCNEVGYFQDAAPLGVPSLVSRLVQPSADLRTCSFMFPENYKNGAATLPNTLATNIKYKGWGTRHPRIYFGTGQRDPWREATVAAEGLNYPNTTDHTVGYSTDGYHCSDLLTRDGVASTSVLKVQKQGLAAIARWLGQFKPKHTRPKRAPAPERMHKPIAGWNGGVNPPLGQ